MTLCVAISCTALSMTTWNVLLKKKKKNVLWLLTIGPSPRSRKGWWLMWTIAGNRYWGEERKKTFMSKRWLWCEWVGIKKKTIQHRCWIWEIETYWESFARASLCNSNHIFATEGKRPALSLDRGGFRPVHFVDHIHHISWGRGAIKNVF